MSTKPPTSVKQYPADSLEHLAYQFVADIPTQEPNDRNRLGYCLWIWLKDQNGTLEQAVRTSGVRSSMPLDEMVRIIRDRISAQKASA